MTDVYIIDCVRTPVAQGRNKNGALHNIHPVTLLSIVLDELAQRNNLNKKEVEDVICGCVTPMKEQGGNIPRFALLKAGYPCTTAGVQLNRMCGSGQQAIHFASQAIAAGDIDMAIGCGIEMMSVVRMGSDVDPSIFSTDPNGAKDVKFGPLPFKLLHQGVSADKIGKSYNLTREECDLFAAQSHEKCYNATKNGVFKSQIVPIKVKKQDGSESWFLHDEGIRYPIDVSKMAKLRNVFSKDGVVTAGNASQLSDGAGAVLLASGKKADELGLRKRARIVARVAVGSDPEMMLDGVIPATRKVLKKANLTIDDIDVFEINEAFASVVLSWKKTLNVPDHKINPNGGAIAHGHPLGATGCVLMAKLVNELERTKKRYGLQVMCIGFGQATATIIERV